MHELWGWRAHAWDGELQWEAFSRPRPGAGEVLVRVEACGIGQTVVNYLTGNLTTDESHLPRVPGHEFAGTVIDTGVGADPGLVGQHVVPYFYLTCGRCSMCLSDNEPRCSSLGGFLGTHRDGGYAPWAVLPARSVVPVAADLDPVAATVVPDAVATPVHVCRTRARIEPGDRVAVIGAGGGVGIHMAQMAKLFGADVADLDLTGPKLAELDRLGIRPVDASDLDAVDPRLFDASPPTAVIDLVGTVETVSWGVRALDAGGRLIVVTTVRGRDLGLVLRDLVFREISVLGSRYAKRSEVAIAAELVRSGHISPVISQIVEPGAVPSVHTALRAGTLLGRGAVRWDSVHGTSTLTNLTSSTP